MAQRHGEDRSPEYWQALTDGILGALDAIVEERRADIAAVEAATGRHVTWDECDIVTSNGRTYIPPGAKPLASKDSDIQMPDGTYIRPRSGGCPKGSVARQDWPGRGASKTQRQARRNASSGRARGTASERELPK